MAEKDNRINENTRAIHRASMEKAFGAKPAPTTTPTPAPAPAEKKSTQLDMDAKNLQSLLGDEVSVKPSIRMAKGGKVSSASKRADGCAIKGKTRGKMV
jgi:hypothetical protein